MGTESNTQFFEKVARLREKIRELRLSRRQRLSEKALIKVREVVREKIENIIEFSLLQRDLPIDRDIIRSVVEEEIDKNPIYTAVQKGEMTIKEAQVVFAALIEDTRVKNQNLRYWIAGLVNMVIAQTPLVDLYDTPSD